ncbi:hypothetical protein [Clostridium tertium]|uniref:hypothetical protein n=1 Tax=Clostridium tertium TaxID=1559 RepID=UPI0023B3200F|nr:hypothetical protein [Clostridium tertium]
MKVQILQLPINVESLLESGYTLLLISDLDYCIIKKSNNMIIDMQTNIEVDINKHNFNKAYIVLDNVTDEIIAKDDIDRLFHLAGIKKI